MFKDIHWRPRGARRFENVCESGVWGQTGSSGGAVNIKTLIKTQFTKTFFLHVCSKSHLIGSVTHTQIKGGVHNSNQ